MRGSSQCVQVRWREQPVCSGGLEGAASVCRCVGRSSQCVQVGWREQLVCAGGLEGAASVFRWVGGSS